uniref:Uncharacterized protein n=1 Tax=Mus spicilegus TaxID=10103 RepID=A0A8C6HZY9_MUSSI
MNTLCSIPVSLLTLVAGQNWIYHIRKKRMSAAKVQNQNLSGMEWKASRRGKCWRTATGLRKATLVFTLVILGTYVSDSLLLVLRLGTGRACWPRTTEPPPSHRFCF